MKFEDKIKQLEQKAIEVRGLKVNVSEIDIPMSFGPAFEGERIRKDDLFMECGGGRTSGVEVLISKEMNEVVDGEVIGHINGAGRRAEVHDG